MGERRRWWLARSRSSLLAAPQGGQFAASPGARVGPLALAPTSLANGSPFRQQASEGKRWQLCNLPLARSAANKSELTLRLRARNHHKPPPPAWTDCLAHYRVNGRAIQEAERAWAGFWAYNCMSVAAATAAGSHNSERAQSARFCVLCCRVPLAWSPLALRLHALL